MRPWLFALVLLVAACAHGMLQASDACRSHCDATAQSGACRQATPEEVASQHPFFGYRGCLGSPNDPSEQFCNDAYRSCVASCEKSRADAPPPP